MTAGSHLHALQQLRIIRVCKGSWRMNASQSAETRTPDPYA
eukprot:CAMPEP_0184329148 /NCGR_PEP_ID=MMETSP1049-20130417/143995_1 /TAXON_ID=77928 /ORGANISM="Proteomonas sulcata, Strain CCMP704" /LENGTH=40 /DNA_ID= /DNA_START= /DNA_END= /DNA_ORIENTATION=